MNKNYLTKKEILEIANGSFKNPILEKDDMLIFAPIGSNCIDFKFPSIKNSLDYERQFNDDEERREYEKYYAVFDLSLNEDDEVVDSFDERFITPLKSYVERELKEFEMSNSQKKSITK